MNAKFILSSFLLITVSSALTGCGSSTKVTSTNERSVGQQLTDLSAAHQQGIISDREYEKLKKAIIKEND